MRLYCIKNIQDLTNIFIKIMYNKFMMNLNNNQQHAAMHLHGPMMVLAGPGSGKTAVITERTRYLIESEQINAHEILVITYSKAAAMEMQHRFHSLMPSAPPVMFGTFHAVFFRMLRRRFDYGMDVLMSEQERRTLMRTMLTQLGYEADEDMLSAVLTEMSLVRNEMYHLEYYYSKHVSSEDFKEIFRAYEIHKKNAGKIDFDDMLIGAYDLLRTDEKTLNYWKSRFKYIMIDEFQDINRVQYEAMKLLAGCDGNILVVGDDDQSIYGFRGSKPEFLLNFPNDFPDCASVTLDVNYRSSDEIIAVANRLISKNQNRYNKLIVGTNRQAGIPKYLITEDQNHEAVYIAEKIRNLIQSGIDVNEIVVAFRLNIQSRAFMDAFLNMNITFKCREEIPSIYEHWVAQDIFSYLRVIRRIQLRQKIGYDADAFRIINKPFRYISKAFLETCKKNDQDVFSAFKSSKLLHMATKNTIEEMIDRLLRAPKNGVSEQIKYIRKFLEYNTYIVDHANYRKMNVDGLNEILDELIEAAKPYQNALEFIAHAMQTIEATKDKKVLDNSDAVTLTTLHSAKGLEFEHVFIVGVNEEVLPYIKSKTTAEIEEERRLMYVGITRAKTQLYISSVVTRYDKEMKISRFVEEMKS